MSQHRENWKTLASLSYAKSSFAQSRIALIIPKLFARLGIDQRQIVNFVSCELLHCTWKAEHGARCWHVANVQFEITMCWEQSWARIQKIQLITISTPISAFPSLRSETLTIMTPFYVGSALLLKKVGCLYYKTAFFLHFTASLSFY